MQHTSIVLFGGYSGSGKSEYLTPILKNLGFTVFSSSVILHEFVDNLIQEVLGIKDYNSYDRTLEIEGSILSTRSSDLYQEIRRSKMRNILSRDLCVQVAEKCLIPVFTRSIFSHAIVDKILKSENRKLAVEVFKQEEYSLLRSRLKKELPEESILSVNLRRQSENPEVDSRELIPLAEDIWNDSDYKGLETKVLNFLS